MDVSVRDLRNHTGKVIAAIESGEPVVLTVHGRPVADIVPHVARAERRSSEALLSDLAAIAALASEAPAAAGGDPPRLDELVAGFSRDLPGGRDSAAGER